MPTLRPAAPFAGPVQTCTPRTIGRALFTVGVACSIVAPLRLHAQRVPPSVLVTHVNDYAAGYDEASHSYRPQWIKDVLTDASSRAIHATALGPFTRTVTVKQTVTGDHVTCPDVPVSAPLLGVTALRWTVLGPHPATGQVGVVQTVTRQLKKFVFRRSPGCRPNSEPLTVGRDELQFNTSLSTASRTSLPPEYRIRVEAIDASGAVRLTAESKAVVVARHVPLVVSIGESLASGQGNPDERGAAKVADNGTRRCKDHTTWAIKQGYTPAMAKQPKWLDKRDYRSLRSAHALAVKQLLSGWPYIVFITYAKSGSHLTSGAPDQYHDLLEQLIGIQRTIGAHPIDVLLMSIGGNDVGFGNTLKNLTKHNATPISGESIAHREARINKRIDSLDRKLYPQVNRRIAKLGLKVNSILINEYPGSLFNNRRNKPARGCGVFEADPFSPFVTLTEDEAAMIDRLGKRLNKAVKNAAGREGWHLVDGIDEDFQGHGYCSGDSWFVFAEDSCLDQGDFEGMMHPNKHGTGVVATNIARELRKLLPSPTNAQPAANR
jgi:hypothetical protein